MHPAGMRWYIAVLAAAADARADGILTIPEIEFHPYTVPALAGPGSGPHRRGLLPIR